MYASTETAGARLMSPADFDQGRDDRLKLALLVNELDLNDLLE